MEKNLPATTWFQRNPKKTIIGILTLFLLILAIIAEFLLGYWHEARKMEFTRYIRLRECEPNYVARLTPTDDFMRATDSLVRRKYLLRVDKHGFTRPSLIHERPDLTIAFFGGSTTACLLNEEEKRFPYVVGRLIEQKTQLTTNSINAARGGNNSIHSVNILLNKVVPFQPQLAVIMNNINDLTTLMYGSYWDLHTERSQIIYIYPEIINVKKVITQKLFPNVYLLLKNTERAIRKNILYKFRNKKEDDEFQHKRGKLLQIDQPAIVAKFSRSLQSFVSVCQVWRITPVLMTQANRLKEQPDAIIRRQVDVLKKQGVSYARYKELYEAFNQAIREVGKERGVLVIDLAREVPPDREYMYDVVHFTDRGSEYAAEVIAKNLLPLVKSHQQAIAGR